MENKILNGDVIEMLKTLEDNSIDSIVTDPPYHLTSITKRFGKENSAPASEKNNDGSFSRLSKGFMGKAWDGTDENGLGIAFDTEMWKEAYRVLKPGGYMCAFSGSRTYHRMACAIEDSGFEIIDCIEWIYGSGFPKSLDISKAIDKQLSILYKSVSNEIVKSGKTDKEIADYVGVSPALVRFWRLNERNIQYYEYKKLGEFLNINTENDDIKKILFNREVVGKKENQMSGWNMDGSTKFIDRNITAPATDEAKQFSGFKTALKPAHEPICLCRKPLSEKNFALNVLKWGTGGMNIDGSRIGTEKREYKGAGGTDTTLQKGALGSGTGKDLTFNVEGRYPANLIISKDIAPVIDKQSGFSKGNKPQTDIKENIGDNLGAYEGGWKKTGIRNNINDQGGASRYFKQIEEDIENEPPFFYCAKASKKERNSDYNGQTIEIKQEFLKLKEDLTDEEKKYVMAELEKLKIQPNKID